MQNETILTIILCVVGVTMHTVYYRIKGDFKMRKLTRANKTTEQVEVTTGVKETCKMREQFKANVSMEEVEVIAEEVETETMDITQEEEVEAITYDDEYDEDENTITKDEAVQAIADLNDLQNALGLELSIDVDSELFITLENAMEEAGELMEEIAQMAGFEDAWEVFDLMTTQNHISHAEIRARKEMIDESLEYKAFFEAYDKRVMEELNAQKVRLASNELSIIH